MNYKKDRDADMRRRAQAHLQAEQRRGANPSLRRIAVLTVYGGASSFFMEYIQARRLLSEYRRSVESGTAVRQSDENMFQTRIRHISEAVDREMAADPVITLCQALRRVLIYGSAPRFYVSIPSAMDILRPVFKPTVVYNPFGV